MVAATADIVSRENHRSCLIAAFVKVLLRRLDTEKDWIVSRRARADLAVFHEFHPPPYGGGNQFLLALVGELERRGLAVEANTVSGGTSACLFNSFNFDFRRLERFARDSLRMVHRVDGPVGVYRGFDDGTDRRIAAVNRKLANATILQSYYSLEKHRELGLELRDPIVIRNAVSAGIFHPPASVEPLSGRRVRVIATSWSDNPRKGADVLAWLDAPQATAGAGLDRRRDGGRWGGHQAYRIRGLRTAYRMSTRRFTTRKTRAKMRIVLWTTK